MIKKFETIKNQLITLWRTLQFSNAVERYRVHRKEQGLPDLIKRNLV